MNSIKVKKICCIGAGYVGGPTMSVIADNCPDIEITVVDINKKRIDDWNEKDLTKLPIYEPGLSELVKKNYKAKRLSFTTSISDAVQKSNIIFLCVGTPTKKNTNAADLSQIYSAAKEISKKLTMYFGSCA